MKKKIILIVFIVLLALGSFSAGLVSAKAHYDIFRVFMDGADEAYILWNCPMDITFNGDYGLILRCEQ